MLFRAKFRFGKSIAGQSALQRSSAILKRSDDTSDMLLGKRLGCWNGQSCTKSAANLGYENTSGTFLLSFETWKCAAQIDCLVKGGFFSVVSKKRPVGPINAAFVAVVGLVKTHQFLAAKDKTNRPP